MIRVLFENLDNSDFNFLVANLTDYYNSHKADMIKSVESLDAATDKEFLDGWGPENEYLGWNTMEDFNSLSDEDKSYWLDPEYINVDKHFNINEPYVRALSDGIESATDETKYYEWFIVDHLVKLIIAMYYDLEASNFWFSDIDLNDFYVPSEVYSILAARDYDINDSDIDFDFEED